MRDPRRCTPNWLLDREIGAWQAPAEQIDTIVRCPLIGQTQATEHLSIGRRRAPADRDIPQRQTEHDRRPTASAPCFVNSACRCRSDAPPRRSPGRPTWSGLATCSPNMKPRAPHCNGCRRRSPRPCGNWITARTLWALPAPRVTPDLLRLTRDRAARDPEQTAAAASRAATERQTSLAALARAPGWTGDAEALIALGILPRDACQRLDAACAEAERVFDRTAQELECLQRDLAQSRKVWPQSPAKRRCRIVRRSSRRGRIAIPAGG